MSQKNSLNHRHLQPELMDQPGLAESAHHQALNGLVRINRWSGTASTLWRAIRDYLRAHTHRPVTILDVACGAGDMACALWNRGKHSDEIRVVGCDISEVALRHARSRAKRLGANVEFFRHDVLRDDLPESYDIVTSSLFLHHLNQEEVMTFLRKLRQSVRKLLLIDDLRRGAWGWWLAYLGTRILSRSNVVHVDGPRSVEGAFTPEEVLSLAEEAGLTGASIKTHWPARMLLRWEASRAIS